VLTPRSVKMIFLNTDKLPGKESRAGDLVYNQVEANLIHQVSRTHPSDARLIPSSSPVNWSPAV
jgi:hypothetical protein